MIKAIGILLVLFGTALIAPGVSLVAMWAGMGANAGEGAADGAAPLAATAFVGALAIAGGLYLLRSLRAPTQLDAPDKS